MDRRCIDRPKAPRPREHRPINMGSLSWRACSPRDASLSIIGFEDEMTWSRPGSGDRREPRTSSRHLWHLSERVRASSLHESSNVKGSSVSPVMSGGAGTSLGPGLPVSQLRLRHLTYGRAGQTARTRMPHARGVAPARRDPPETRRCCASKDENGRVPRTAVGDVAVGNLYAATTVSVRISTPAGTTPVST